MPTCVASERSMISRFVMTRRRVRGSPRLTRGKRGRTLLFPLLALPDDLRADALLGEDLEEHGVAPPAVDHVRLLDAGLERLDAALDLRDHPRADHAAADELGNLLGRERPD